MYNLTNVSEYSGGPGPLPPGEYQAVILDAEATKSKAGAPMIKITFDINGTKIYDYLTLDSQNQKSFNIGMSKAKSILMATKCTNFNFRNEKDMADAMVGDLFLEVDVKTEEYQGTIKEKNIIKKYSPVLAAPTRRGPRPSSHFVEDSSIPF